MSEIRLVRCPKCDKVLPEPAVCTVYQCGGCGAMLRAKKKLSGSEKLANCDTDFDKGVKESGGLREGHMIGKGSFDMDNRSPARSTFGDGDGRKSESDLTEFRGGSHKSPLRDRFLNDLGSSPRRSRNVSPSSMRGRGSSDFDFDVVGISPTRSRNPFRERGSRSPMSVRTRHASRSPMREPERTMNGDILNSLPRGGSVSDECAEKEQEGKRVDSDGAEERDNNDRMTVKTSFNTWLPDDSHSRESNDKKLGGGRMKWRDLNGDEADRISEGKESVYADEPRMTSEKLIDYNSIHGSSSSPGRIDNDLRFRDEYAGGIGISRTRSDENEVTRGSSRVVDENRRKSASSSSVDGSLSCHPESIHGHGHSRYSFETQRGPERHEFCQKYQGSKQQYPSKQPSEFDYSEEEHFRIRQGSKQQFSPDHEHMPRPSHFNHEPYLVHEMEDTYLPPLYDDPVAGKMRSGWRPKHPQFPHRPMRGYAPGKSLDFDQDSLRFNCRGTHRHHDLNGWHDHDLSSSLGHMMSSTHSTSSHSMDLRKYGPRTYDSRMAYTSPRERPSHLGPTHARRIPITGLNKRICLPIAGGAPFVLCHKCFELLKLPGKFMTKRKNEYQLQCGACSSVMSFDPQNKSIGIHSSENKSDPAEVDSSLVAGLKDSGPRHHHDSFTATSTNIGSYDFDAIGYGFNPMGSAANEAIRGGKRVPIFDDYTGESSHSSKDERVSDSASIRSSLPDSSEILLKIRPPPGSPLQDHLDYSTLFHIGEAKIAGNCTGEEKKILEKNTSQDSSVINTAVSVETEVQSPISSKKLSDSGDAPGDNKEEKKPSPRPHKWRPFAPRSGSTSPVKCEVYVNGQLVPLHVMKKAEKLAGTIEPGDYWYDPKAGFWGVMGHHCLGIIPPSIQEFCFPMPENCCRGDTGVYVNGRELQKRDLDLLSSRGLPTMRDKRYIVDISGKVLEEQSKDFIANLGKLAPTVEKKKCGFGMRVPEEFDD